MRPISDKSDIRNLAHQLVERLDLEKLEALLALLEEEYFSPGEVEEIKALCAAEERCDWSQTETDALRAAGAIPGTGVQREQTSRALRTAHEQFRNLSTALMASQEDERRYIARELHDEIGQTLTGLKLHLDLLSRSVPENLTESLAEAHALVDDAMKQVRELAFGLRPQVLDDLGLLPAVLWLVKRYTAQTTVHVDVHHCGLDRRFSPEVEIAVYRTVQEALTNAARYAGVDRVQVRLQAAQDCLSVAVEDEGAGFDVEAVWASGACFGLRSMRERVETLGGRFVIDSVPGAGTRLTAVIPLCHKSTHGSLDNSNKDSDS